jgi:hypothetical protein
VRRKLEKIDKLTAEVGYYKEAIARGEETIRKREEKVKHAAQNDRAKCGKALNSALHLQRGRAKKLKASEEALEQARRG